MEDWQKEIPPESAIHATKDDKLSALISCKSSQTLTHQMHIKKFLQFVLRGKCLSVCYSPQLISGALAFVNCLCCVHNTQLLRV